MRFVLAAVVFLCVGVPSPLADESAKPSEVQVTKEKTIENSIGMKFVLIPKGTCLMGAPPDEEGRDDDEPQHEVTMTRDFRIGVHEVTQSQYRRVMGENLSNFTGVRIADRHLKTGRVVKAVDSANHPVDSVSHEDAAKFCRRLSELPDEQTAGRGYRPSARLSNSRRRRRRSCSDFPSAAWRGAPGVVWNACFRQRAMF